MPVATDYHRRPGGLIPACLPLCRAGVPRARSNDRAEWAS